MRPLYKSTSYTVTFTKSQYTNRSDPLTKKDKEKDVEVEILNLGEGLQGCRVVSDVRKQTACYIRFKMHPTELSAIHKVRTRSEEDGGSLI